MRFGENEGLDPIAATERRTDIATVLIDPRGKMGGDTDVEHAMRPARHDVGPAALCHRAGFSV
jgi:hypothetical protein